MSNDSTSYTLICPFCHKSEKIKVIDQGCNYSGSDWQSNVQGNNFKIQWTGKNPEEPQIVKVICIKCAKEANYIGE